MKKKRVAIFTTDLYQGGVAESARKIVNLVESDGVLVHVLVYDTVPVLKQLPESVKLFRVRMPLSAGFARSGFGRLLKKLLRIPGMAFCFFYIAWYKVYHRPDVVYSMMYVPNLINILTKTFSSCRIIVSERQDPEMDLISRPVFGRILRYLYRRADLIHANSPGMVHSIRRYYRVEADKIVHIDNFFDLDEITAQADFVVKNPLPLNRFNLVTSGRLSKQKGHWHLIRALSKLNRDDVSLFILGEGELKDELTSLALQCNVQDRVHFLGNVSNPHSVIAQCNIFIFPSIWESFGNALVEAMALGLPVISTSCPSGPGDIIDWGRYGIDIGVLPPYEAGPLGNCDAVDRVVSSIRLLILDSDKYGKYSQLSLERAQYYSVQSAKEKFLRMLVG